MSKDKTSFKSLLHGFIWTDLFKNADDKINIREVLKQNIFFEQLSDSEIRYLEKIVHIRNYQSGETVFSQNETGIGMYIIVKGKISIRTHLDALAKEDQPIDQETQITVLTEGSFLGEQALVEQENIRTASAYALEPSQLISFLKPDLIDIVNRRPSLGIKIVLRLAKVLSKRLKITTEKLSELSRQANNDHK